MGVFVFIPVLFFRYEDALGSQLTSCDIRTFAALPVKNETKQTNKQTHEDVTPNPEVMEEDAHACGKRHGGH